MKALAVLSKFMGYYDVWKEIKEWYKLKWSDEKSTGAFKKILNEDNSFNCLLEWLKDTLPKYRKHIEIFFYLLYFNRIKTR